MRGQAIRGAIAAFGTLESVDAVKRLVAALPAPVGPALRDDVISGSGWYPLPWLGTLHRTAHEVAGGGMELSRKLGFLSTQNDARGIYRFVLSFVEPRQIVKHADRVLPLYLEGPRFVLEDASRTSATFAIEECHGAEPCLWENIMGSIAGLIEVSGGAHAMVVALDGGGSSPRLQMRADWEL